MKFKLPLPKGRGFTAYADRRFPPIFIQAL